MKELMALLEKRYNAFTLRERILICGALIAVVYATWHTILYDYVMATDEEIAKKADDIKSQINLLEGQIDSISEVVGRNPTSVLIDQVRELKLEDDALNKKIVDGTKKMVSAKQMAIILQGIIAKTSGLTLVNMESLETKALFPSKVIQDGDKSVTLQAFTHGLKIEMLGGYFETLQFLQAVEQQDSMVIWDTLSYEVVKYPQAKITIYLHTLGLDEGWIGV